MTNELKLPVGTLVRMLPSTDAKKKAVEGHGHLWVVIGHDDDEYYRNNKLKSVATGYTEYFNINGLEAFDEQKEGNQ